MNKELKFTLLMSLEDMALGRLTASLWSSLDILAPISKLGFYFGIVEKEWYETFEPNIKNKVLKLELPELLKKKLFEIIRPVGFQIKIWKDLQAYHLSRLVQKFCFPDSAKLCWTSNTLVDYRRTAEELVHCDELDVELRYELACINCLEDEIPLLWDKLSEKQRDYFYNRDLRLETTSPYLFQETSSNSLFFYWPHILKGELSTLDNLCRSSGIPFYQWAFEQSAKTYNKCAVEYFFQKLRPVERETSLMRTVEDMLRHKIKILSLYFRGCEILRHLFLLMTTEQQMKIIRNHTSEVLLRLHDVPWANIFLENLEIFWTYLPPHHYDELLLKMKNRFRMSDPYFPKFFREFFTRIPIDFKNYFFDTDSEVEMSPVRCFLFEFLESDDSESIEAMLKHVDTANRLKIISHPDVFRLFFGSILNGKWAVVEACLRELSEEDRKNLKEAFTRFLNRIVSGKLIDRKFKRFFELLNESRRKDKSES